MKVRNMVWMWFLCVTALLPALPALAAEFAPALEYQLEQARDQDFVGAIIILESPIDIQALDTRLHVERATKARRHREVVEALRYNAEMTQPKFRTELDAAKAAGQLEGYTAYWIENLFVIRATRQFIEGLRDRADVKYVTENFRAELIAPIREAQDSDDPPITTLTCPPGIRAVGALRVNQELGITGAGVLVGNCDTGVDGNHPALAARWRGLIAPWQQCWMDNLGGGTTFPTDGNGHGTHVMGTITGRAISGADTTWVGCAPGARWIANNAINQGVNPGFDNDIIQSYQWFIDPDGNPNTTEDVPDVIQNSWGVNQNLGYVTCYDFWNTVILNCEAGGTVVTWSAGNESTSGLRSPAIYSINETQIFAVGSVDASNYPNAPYPLSGFSSQGPTPCTPANPNNIKPEISAPGSAVYSSLPGGSYGNLSGTSMAGPHVAGVVALMREACPDCDPTTIKMAIINTAIRTGYVTPPATENNQFGNGFIDAYAAVLAVSNLGRVAGVVRDAANNPLAGATVQNANGAQLTTTDAAGQYYLALQSGTYTIRYSKFGYTSQDVAGITVVQGDTTIQNVTLQLAPQGTVSGIVTDCNGSPAVGATVTVLNTPVPAATTNGSGFYSITLAQGTYDMQAAGTGCAPHTVTAVVVGASTTQNFTLLVDPRALCSAPDGYGYTACENTDANGPVYSWIGAHPSEGGSGTVINQSCDDCNTGPLTFPFPGFMFYGVQYPSYYVGSNGYVTFNTGSTTYGNSCLPASGMPAGVYPFWDDLYTGCGSADVVTWYNQAGGYLVIEWYQTCHCCSEGNYENFEVIIYDPAMHPTATGDAKIVVQYNSLSQTGSNTVGIQSAGGGQSLLYQCNGALEGHAYGVAQGRAIRFWTGAGCEGSPDVSLSATSCEASCPVGGTAADSIQICNQGTCRLDWSVAWQQLSPALLVQGVEPVTTPDAPKDEALGAWANVVQTDKTRIVEERGNGTSPLDDQGGPDLFGYSWIDSNEPAGPDYAWVELAGIGQNTGINSDDQIVTVTLPWTFSYYGNPFTSIVVSSNGNLQMGSTGSSAWTNYGLPSTSAPANIIAPFWDDLHCGYGGSTVYTYNDAANNRFVVQWDSVARFSASTQRYTFEVLLYTDGHIVFQYQNMAGDLLSATVGQQNQTQNDGLQIVYNAAYVENNLAVQIASTPPVWQWLSIPSATSGQLQPGQCAWVRLNFDAGEMPAGNYNGTLTYTSNDPDEQTVAVPVTFQVGQLNPPTGLTLQYLPGTNQLEFRWTGSGAPLYIVKSGSTPAGPFDAVVGQTAGTSLVAPFSSANNRLFYVVVASTGGFAVSEPSSPVSSSSK